MNWSRKCRQCQALFIPDARSRRAIGKTDERRATQRFCSKPECQKASHQRSNRMFWKKDPECRTRNVLACRAWRQENKAYWQKRRERDKEYTERNRELQKRRDAKRRGDLANTDAIKPLQREKLSRILGFVDLANTDATKMSWMLVSEEICLYLMWLSRLANTNLMAKVIVDNPQSCA